MRDAPLANQQTHAALKFKGYDVKLSLTMGPEAAMAIMVVQCCRLRRAGSGNTIRRSHPNWR